MSDLIERQDVLNVLRNLAFDHTFQYGEYYGEDERQFTIINAGKAIDAIESLPSTEIEWKWIPVSERLPEVGQRVLITHKGGVSFGWYNGSYWERGAPTNHRPLQTVIAWMPLPESYKGE